ncbi:carbohydrate ABC transporter substrate-binding protein [Longibaculum muris]|uniref:carbohydrate ABC transporter substrate-binding protein n=1 Tax=Longibaculum muris TaxID=1796628 RepID=UPI0012B7A2D4|nr:carbohydrate ABC transporter substrate-binding protein [Longibaculum muris]
MNTKKVLSLGLSVLMCGTLLAGCGGNKEEKGADASGKTLKIAGLDGGYGTKGWEAVAKKFEEAKGCKVELQFEKNIADTLRPVITSGKDVPDIIYLSVGSEGGLTDTLVKEKAITDISSVLDLKVDGKTVKEKILPGFTDSLTSSPYSDGKLYLAPINYGPCGLFYNAGLFKSKGWEVPKTWDEMFELGEKAKKEGIALFTYPTTGYFDAFFSALLNEAVGPEKYNKLMNYDTATWKDAGVKKAFETVGKLAKYIEKNTVSNANKEGFTKNQQLILDNKALFCPNGTWLPGEMKDAPRAKGFEWGFTALPKLTADGDAYSTTFVEQMYIPAASSKDNKDLAKEFIAYCYSDEAAKLFYENGGAVMPITTASSLMGENDQNKLYYSVYDNGAKANAVGFAAADAIEGVDLTSADGILYGTVNSVMTGKKTVDQWYDAVIKAVQKYDK